MLIVTIGADKETHVPVTSNEADLVIPLFEATKSYIRTSEAATW